MENKIESVQISKTTVQAIANYLLERPYKEVAEIAGALFYEANNQKLFESKEEEDKKTNSVQ